MTQHRLTFSSSSLCGFVIALAIASLSTPAHAQRGGSALIDATNPERIAAVARGYGSVEIDKDKQGDPLLRGRMDGKQYLVYFYECKAGKSCRTIQFRAWFEVKDKPTAEQLQDYNRRYRFLKVFLDDDADLVVEFDMNLDGGVSQKNLDETFDWWKVSLANVAKSFPGK